MLQQLAARTAFEALRVPPEAHRAHDAADDALVAPPAD